MILYAVLMASALAIVAVVKLKCRTVHDSPSRSTCCVGHGIVRTDFPDSADIKPIKALAIMAVNTAQSFLRTAWHPVPQTSLVAVCKLTVQTYRVSRSD